ncbi:MAG: hypothetical protein IKM43_02965 [Clostridia bacterium]|nr:hypothetical protein [Clostridia bacterium]
MIDIYDSETIVKTYRLLSKKCDAIDKFIRNHAMYFGPCTLEYGAEDVCNNIIDLITRKNQLINLKVIVDTAIKGLKEEDKKVLFVKMHYSLTMSELCGVLELKERTAFRRIEHAYLNLANALNRSKYLVKLETILNAEDWILAIKDDLKNRRMAYKCEVTI